MSEQTRAPAPENRPQTIDPIKKLNEPIRVFMDPSISYEAKPVTSWAEIDRWEKKWQVKKGPGKNESVSLPTYIQENTQKIFDIGWEQGFIKADDIKNIRKVIETNDVDKDGKRRTYEEDPFQFLNTHLDADPKKPPEFPKTLTEQQQVDLISFIYSKITADPKVEDSSQPDGFKHFGNRFLNEVIKKFGPEVNKYNPKHGPNFSDQSQWLIGFNIATRKAIDTMMSAQSYTPTERVMQKLEQKMVIAGGVSQKEPGVFKATGSMKPTNETTGRSEASFDKDMLMRRTLEVAIPPEAMAQMTRDEFQSTRKDISYLERGEAKMRLEKQRELWSLATLDYFGFRREMPGLQSLANEREKHLTRPELEMIDAYKDRVGKRVAELGGLSGEFGAMNPLEANLKKTEGLVVALVDDKKLTKQAEERFHRENKQRKTIRPEELVAMKAKIKNELSEKVESLLKKPRVIQERVTNPQADPDDQKTEFRYQYTIDEMVKESGITDGFEGEEKTHIMKALVDGLKNRESIEPLYKSPENYNGELNHGLMKRLDDKEGGAHKVEDYIINTNLALGLKGLEFVNRNLASKVIKEEKRYPGFTITRGSKGEVHLNSSLSKATKGEGEGGMVQVKNVQSAESTTQPTKEEVDAKEVQKIKDAQAVELAKLLGFKEPIANEAEFRDNMLGSEIFVLVDNQEGNGQHYEINVEILELTSVEELNSLSHLSEFYPNTPIMVESLNLSVGESGNLETNPIQNFNIENLILSGPTSDGSETNIALVGGSCDYIEIRQGQFNISTNTLPIRVAMTEGDQAKASRMIFTENSLAEIVSRNNDIRSEFLMGENSVIQIEIQGEGPQGENKVIYEDSESHNVSKDNTGTFILIQENGQYKLVDSEYKFPGETIESNGNLLGSQLPIKAEEPGEINELGLQILHEKMRNDVLLDADDRAVAIDMMTRGLGNRTATVTNIDYALKLYDDAVAQGVTIPAEISEVVQRVRVLESVKRKRVVQAEAPASELINAVLKIEYPEEGEAPPQPDPTRKTEEPAPVQPVSEKFKHKQPEEVAAMDPAARIDYLQAELRATSGSRQRLALVRRIVNECSENGVNVDDLIPKLGALSGVTGPELATSPILVELMDDVSKLTITEGAPAPQPEAKGETDLESFFKQHEVKPTPVPELAVSLEEQPEPAADLLVEQPSAASQPEALGEVHTDVPVPTEAPSRPGIGDLWANRPAWLFRRKEKVDEETAGGTKPTRAEVVRARRGQTQVISNPAIDPATTVQSAIPVNASQTDTTLFESPASVPPRQEEPIETKAPNIQVTEAPAADDTPDLLKPASPAKKIASADESSSGGGAAAEDDLDIPTWLKNRR